ncbi:MAG: DUF4127 family protein [bacterium]|jgi:hypothetical protein
MRTSAPVSTVEETAPAEAAPLSDPMQESILKRQILPQIALVPLDSRPCNWLYPLRLADIAGVRLHVPPLEFLGWRDRAGDPGELFDWMDALPKETEALLVSLDALLYGGLVQSRTPDEAIKPPEEIADFLARFLAARPGCKLHCFKSVPRLGKTVLSAADLKSHEALRARTLTGAPVAGEGDAEAAAAEDIEWQNHQIARSRNQNDHAGLLAALLPHATSWVIAIEDNHPDGPQNREVKELLSELPRELDKKVTVVNGCDEQGMVMLARHLRDKIEGRLPVGIWWTYPDSIDKIANFEGVPVGTNLARFMEHLRLSPIEAEFATWSKDAAVIVDTAPEVVKKREAALLVINNFEEEQKDHLKGGSPQAYRPYEGEGPMPWLLPVLLLDSLDIYIADIAWCNGGDPAMDSVLSQGNGNFLAGYSGWNTAGNTIGKALAHIVARAYRAASDPVGTVSTEASWAHERFKFESLLSDRWFPQIVRPRLWKMVLDAGGDPWHFGLYTVEMVEKGCEDLRKPVRGAWDQRHRGNYLRRGISVPKALLPEINFPWNRLFEVDIRIYHDDAFDAELYAGSPVK